MRMRKGTVISISAIIAVVVLIFAVWGIKLALMINKFEHMPQPKAAVTVTHAKQLKWQPAIHTIGTLRAVQGVSITPQTSGRVTKINFKSGQMVKRGQVLVQLDDTVLQAQLEQARAAMRLAKINFNRMVKLKAEQAISQSSYDTSQATLAEDKANVRQYEAQIAHTKIKAPFSGRLGLRQIDIGQYLSPQTVVTNIQQLNPIFVDYSVPTKFLNAVHDGQKVEVTTNAYPGVQYHGVIKAVDSEISADTRSIQVRAELVNNQSKSMLYPGLLVKVSTLLPAKTNVVIPQQAIQYTLYGDSVYVIKKDKKGAPIAIIRYIDTGVQNGNNVVVTKGLKAGEEVVSLGQLNINHSGMGVNISTLAKYKAQAGQPTADSDSRKKH